MAYNNKLAVLLKCLNEGTSVEMRMWLDKRLTREAAINECYARYLMLEYDIREMAYRFGPHTFNEHYMIARFDPYDIMKQPKMYTMFFFPEDH